MRRHAQPGHMIYDTARMVSVAMVTCFFTNSADNVKCRYGCRWKYVRRIFFLAPPPPPPPHHHQPLFLYEKHQELNYIRLHGNLRVSQSIGEARELFILQQILAYIWRSVTYWESRRDRKESWRGGRGGVWGRSSLDTVQKGRGKRGLLPLKSASGVWSHSVFCFSTAK